MPSVKRIQFETLIHAPVEAVWRVMLSPEGYKVWTAPFAEGSHFEGSWEQGSKILFLSPSGDGMVSEIEANEPHRFISIRHLGFLANGVEDFSSEAVRAWFPAYENYTFAVTPEGTRLTIDQDVTPEFEDYLRDAWPKALEVLKRICEQAGS